MKLFQSRKLFGILGSKNKLIGHLLRYLLNGVGRQKKTTHGKACRSYDSIIPTLWKRCFKQERFARVLRAKNHERGEWDKRVLKRRVDDLIVLANSVIGDLRIRCHLGRRSQHGEGQIEAIRLMPGESCAFRINYAIRFMLQLSTVCNHKWLDVVVC